MKFLSWVKNFIFKDVSNETESKDLSVLLRILCIVNMLFHLSMFLFFQISRVSTISEWCIAFMVLTGLVFWMTYWDRSSSSLHMYSTMMIVSMVAYSIELGPNVGFQFSLYSIIFLYFYNTGGNVIVKNLATVLVALIVIGDWFILEYLGKGANLTKTESLVVLMISIVFLTVTITTIAYFYNLKFVSNEHKILKYARKLEKLATMDPLTKLQNRRGMLNHLERYIKNSSDNTHLSLALSDIDFFKKINDTYGHEAGDYVLVELGKMFASFMEDKGMIARWGGEEFLFSFEKNNGDYAFEQLNKLKYQIEKKTFMYNNVTFHVTMTFGLEEYDPSLGIEDSVKKADDKLYRGKEEGRNRIIY